MADEQKNQAAKPSNEAAPPTRQAEARAEDEARFTRQELIDGARPAFGVMPEVMVGALSLGSKNKKSFTRSEAADLVKQFQNREVVD